MQRKCSRQSMRVKPAPIAVVDLSRIAMLVTVDGSVPPAGHYHGLSVEDVALQNDGRRLIRLNGSVRGIASALRFLGLPDKADLLLVEYGLPRSLPVHREFQA